MKSYRTLRREGFALLAVLWVIVGLAALSFAASLATRNALATARNRTQLTRARWAANDCLERARAAIAAALLAPEIDDRRGLSGWSALDNAVRRSSLVASAHCDVRLRAVGSRIDINHSDAEMIGALLGRMGITSPRRDSMVDALLDWRDADDVPRPLGAERAWYAAHRRFVPRNGFFGSVREIARVRGFESLGGLDSVLDVEPGRVSLAHASPTVIGALPGLGDEAITRITERRARGLSLDDISALAGQLSPDASQRMLARYADLSHFATTEPDAWILEARATRGAPPVTVIIEARIARAGDRAAIVRLRSWSS